jgi:hypothetical protein
MHPVKLFDQMGLVVFASTLVATFILFFRDTAEFYGSFMAALMAAGLAWATAIILRWLFLAFKQ